MSHWIHDLPGGILGETGPHGVYTALRFIGNVNKVNVMARKNSDYPWLLYDDYRVNLDGEKALGSLFISHATDRLMAVIDIIGTEGILTVDLYKMLITFSNSESLERGKVGLDSISNIYQRTIQLTTNTVNSVLGKTMLSHEIAINDFIKRIQNNEKPLVTAEEGRETVRIMNLLVNELEKVSNT
jgi:predicted dehydrogenase